MTKSFLMLKKESELGIDLRTDIRRLYDEEKLSTREIAKYYGIGFTTSRNWLEWAGVDFRSISEGKEIYFSNMTEEERVAHTKKATEKSRNLRASGELVIDTSHLMGENAVSRRPEVRKKNSEAQKRRTDRTVQSEESYAKMRKSMEKYLRTRATLHEVTLLRTLNENGYFPKFQHAVCRAILDFAFVELKIGIEIDGISHVTRQEKRDSDLIRDEELDRDGWIILRFFNEEIVYQLDETVRMITEVVDDNMTIYCGKRADVC